MEAILTAGGWACAAVLNYMKSMTKIQNRLTETRLTHHNSEIFNTPYLEKVFSNAQQKMNRLEDESQDQCDNLGIIRDSDNEAAVHLGLDKIKTCSSARTQDIVRYYAEIHLGTKS